MAGVFIASRREKMHMVRRIGMVLISLSVPFTLVLTHTLSMGNKQNVSIALAVVLALHPGGTINGFHPQS